MDDRVTRVLELAGDRWALLVVREVSLGLRRLVEAGVLGTRTYPVPGSRARTEYVLTDAGYDLLPVLSAMSGWAERHRGEGSTPVYRHGGCGGRVTARLVCECGEQTAPRDRLIAAINRWSTDRERPMAGALPTTSDATFRDDVLTSGSPVLIEFTATWCPPCRMIAPVLAQMAADLAGCLRVVAIDVDENPVTTRAYRVMGMPTMALFVGGEVVTTITGARPQAMIPEALEPHLAAAPPAERQAGTRGRVTGAAGRQQSDLPTPRSPWLDHAVRPPTSSSTAWSGTARRG